MTPAANVIKLLTPVIYNLLFYAQVFAQLGSKSSLGTNALAYYKRSSITDAKSVMTLTPGANVIKLLTPIIYELLF